MIFTARKKRIFIIPPTKLRVVSNKKRFFFGFVLITFLWHKLKEKLILNISLSLLEMLCWGHDVNFSWIFQTPWNVCDISRNAKNDKWQMINLQKKNKHIIICIWRRPKILLLLADLYICWKLDYILKILAICAQ